MTNILQYVYGKTKQIRSDFKFTQKWGPFFCIVASLFLSMADLTRHIVQDSFNNICESLDRDAHPSAILGVRLDDGYVPLSAKYTMYCYSKGMASMYTETGALSFWGWTFSVAATWLGFILLFVGMFWIMSLPQKLVKQWRIIRGTRRGPGAATAEPLAQA